jgi:hypothetical protein
MNCSQSAPKNVWQASLTFMNKPIKVLIFVALCVCLLALVSFITVATGANLLIVLPAVASAAYLAFLVAHWTILKMTENKDVEIRH